MKQVLRYKGFLGSIEISVKDNCLYGKILFVDDLITYESDTPCQLEEEFKIAVDDYIATCYELGRDVCKPFSGTFNVRIGPELHQKLAQYAVINDKTINDVMKTALAEYIEKSGRVEIIHKHYHTYEYEEKFELQEETWKRPQLRIVNSNT